MQTTTTLSAKKVEALQRREDGAFMHKGREMAHPLPIRRILYQSPDMGMLSLPEVHDITSRKYASFFKVLT